MNDLLAGTVLMGFSILLYLVLHWGSSKSKQPAWMGETLMANLYTPLLLGTLVFGLSYLVRFAISVA